MNFEYHIGAGYDTSPEQYVQLARIKQTVQVFVPLPNFKKKIRVMVKRENTPTVRCRKKNGNSKRKRNKSKISDSK